MTHTGLTILFAVLAGFSAAYWFGRKREAREKRRAAQHMDGNPAFDSGDFGRHYFPASQAETASRLRELLAGCLPVDLSRLHPDDRLVDDLRMDALDSMSTVEFIIAVEKEFGVKISEADAARLRTLRDLTVLVCQSRGAGAE